KFRGQLPRTHFALCPILLSFALYSGRIQIFDFDPMRRTPGSIKRAKSFETMPSHNNPGRCCRKDTPAQPIICMLRAVCWFHAVCWVLCGTEFGRSCLGAKNPRALAR